MPRYPYTCPELSFRGNVDHHVEGAVHAGFFRDLLLLNRGGLVDVDGVELDPYFRQETE